MIDLLLRLLAVAVVVAAVAVTGWWWQRRSGRFRTADVDEPTLDAGQLVAVGLAATGADTLALLLGSPTCAPCVTVKRLLDEVAGERSGFRWAYADAADHLGLVAAHHVRRVPTLFVLAPDGRILARTSGVPARQDLLAVLDRDGDLASAEPAA